VIVELCVRLPLVPVTVMVYVPVGAELDAARFSVQFPEPPVTVIGLKVAVTPEGTPLADNAMSPVKPFMAYNWPVKFTLLP
jgi:hypothetical protein